MKIPKEIKNIIWELKKNNFEAYIVGGCVRDLLREVAPKDWDTATNAGPAEIAHIFQKAGFKTFYENEFGTVSVVLPRISNFKKANKEDDYSNIVEITPFRKESQYTDKRHPDKVEWTKTIKDDLSRRDFTVNAMAINVQDDECNIIDPFEGQKDLENRVIRAVGDPQSRFSEDALRMIRAVRFAVCLGDKWKIEKKTQQAIKKNAIWISAISQERTRDELLKIIMSPRAAAGLDILRKLGLLKYILPELEQGHKISQNKHHIYDVYKHSLLSLDYAAKRNFNKYVRIAALLHDIGKPRTKKGEGPDSTFYNHEVVGAKMTTQILNRLRLSKKDIEKIVKLVRFHLFYYHPDEVGESSVRRLIRNVGLENLEELLQVRMCDRIGSGCPKAEPYKLRHLKYIMDKVSQDPISVKMLKINGNDIMELLGIKPGPHIGQILDILLSRVLNNPVLNNKGHLSPIILELGSLSPDKLENLAQKAREEREELETKQDKMTKKRYWVS